VRERVNTILPDKDADTKCLKYIVIKRQAEIAAAVKIMVLSSST